MSGKEWTLIVVIAFLGGLAGNSIGSYLPRAGSALAEESPPVPKTIAAEEFRVVAKNGSLRAVLGLEPDGACHLIFYDPQGKVRSEVGVNGAGIAEVALYDQEGKKAKPGEFAYLIVPNGGPRFSLVGEAARLTVATKGLETEATLKVDPDHSPVLSLEGRDKGAALLTMGTDGAPNLTLYDQEGYRRAVLGSSEVQSERAQERRPSSSLVLLDKNERVIWRAP